MEEKDTTDYLVIEVDTKWKNGNYNLSKKRTRITNTGGKIKNRDKAKGIGQK